MTKILQNILNKKMTHLEQYQAVLSWCSQEIMDDEYQVIRERFILLHEERFKLKIFASQQRYLKLRENLEHAKKQLMHNQEVARARWQQQIESCQELVENLTIEARKIAGDSTAKGLQLLPKSSFEQYQQAAGAVERVARSLKFPQKLPVVPDLKFHNRDLQYDVVVQAKKATLLSLADSIHSYEEELKQEPYRVKFIKLFSFARWQRWLAIWQYKRAVLPVQSVNMQYAAAEAWFYQQRNIAKNHTGRFYKKCLFPFQQNNEQDYFDQLPEILSRSQKKVQEYQHTFQNTRATQLKNFEQIQLQFSELRTYGIKLYHCLNGFLAATKKLQQSAFFGYFANGAEVIQEKINSIQSCLLQNSHKVQLQAAYKILADFAAIPRHAAASVVQFLKLKERVSALVANKEALSLVHAKIDQLIEDVSRFGGHAGSDS